MRVTRPNIYGAKTCLIEKKWGGGKDGREEKGKDGMYIYIYMYMYTLMHVKVYIDHFIIIMKKSDGEIIMIFEYIDCITHLKS